MDDRDDIREFIDCIPSAQSIVTYTREKYITIKNQITRIKNVVSKVVENNPDVSEGNREKNIFIATYLILGLIKYDHETVRLEKEEDGKIQEKSIKVRNMFGGLIENATVCIGYAQILKNILSEFGIDSKVVLGAHQKLVIGINDRNVDEDDHAWNIVKLDGMEYQCDLTMDAEKISQSYRQPNSPDLNYCLTREIDFRLNHENYDIKVLEYGMSFVEQRKLMQYYFDVFRKIYNPTIEEELEDEIDNPIVSELMDESTNPIYVYNSDNIDDEINIDEEELKYISKQVMGLFEKFKSEPVLFTDQEIGKATVSTPLEQKQEAKEVGAIDMREVEQMQVDDKKTNNSFPEGHDE